MPSRCGRSRGWSDCLVKPGTPNVHRKPVVVAALRNVATLLFNGCVMLPMLSASRKFRRVQHGYRAQSHRNNVAAPPRRICVHSRTHHKTIKLHSGGGSDEELPETIPTIWTEIFWFLTLTVTNSGLFCGKHDNYTLLQNLPHLRLHAGENSAHSRMSRYCGRARFTWAVNLYDRRWRRPRCELPRLSDH